MAIQTTNLQFDYTKYGFRDEEHNGLYADCDGNTARLAVDDDSAAASGIPGHSKANVIYVR